MLKITFKNETTLIYRPQDFTDYRYDGKCFIVIRGTQWIGIYNLDCVATIEYQPWNESVMRDAGEEAGA